jgi:hypothetical protein
MTHTEKGRIKKMNHDIRYDIELIMIRFGLNKYLRAGICNNRTR